MAVVALTEPALAGSVAFESAVVLTEVAGSEVADGSPEAAGSAVRPPVRSAKTVVSATRASAASSHVTTGRRRFVGAGAAISAAVALSVRGPPPALWAVSVVDCWMVGATRMLSMALASPNCSGDDGSARAPKTAATPDGLPR